MEPTEQDISSTPKKTGIEAPALGCGVGGCLIPLLLFIFGLFVMNDIGGPLIWPMLSVFLGTIGLIIGFLVGALKK